MNAVGSVQLRNYNLVDMIRAGIQKYVCSHVEEVLVIDKCNTLC